MGSSSTKTQVSIKQEEGPPPLPQMEGSSVLLNETHIRNLCQHLPPDYKEQWSLLYFSDRHGKSFNRFTFHVQDKGPTILLIKDDKGRIFGGFASESWRKPQSGWYGSSHCFLFTLHPDFVVYKASGYNDHFMYLNLGMEMLPNGVGMGGQHEFFGLWIPKDFESGSTNGTCSTFACPPLVPEKEFKIDIMEVWGVRLPPVEEDENKPKKKSVLHSENNPDKAILTMLDRVGYSNNLEPLEEQTS